MGFFYLQGSCKSCLFVCRLMHLPTLKQKKKNPTTRFDCIPICLYYLHLEQLVINIYLYLQGFLSVTNIEHRNQSNTSSIDDQNPMIPNYHIQQRSFIGNFLMNHICEAYIDLRLWEQVLVFVMLSPFSYLPLE